MYIVKNVYVWRTFMHAEELFKVFGFKALKYDL
jgi:hypothetical protein